MHQTRQQATPLLPIRRKGTKYIVRAFSHVKSSVPVLIAARDMLKIARTAKEVNEMIKSNLLKINWRTVKDSHESIKLFNIFEAGKKYYLSISPTKKFVFLEHKDSKRLCKVVNKQIISKGKFQLNLHDGSNILTGQKMTVGDSVYLDSSGKILGHIPVEKGKNCFVFSGKYSGMSGKIENTDNNTIAVRLEGKTVFLKNKEVIIT